MDASAKEINVKRSFKKFFVDSLSTTSPPTESYVIPIYFDFLYDVPKDADGVKLESWMVFTLGSLQLDVVSNLTAYIYLFSRKDREGDIISSLTDTIYELFEDTTNNNGQKVISLYDTESSPWANVGALTLINIFDVHGVEPGIDKTKFRTLNLTFRWGTII